MTLERGSRWALIILAMIAVFYGLSVARSVFAPFVLALVLGVVLVPLADSAERLRVPRTLSALLTLLLGIGLIAGLIFFLEPAVQQALRRAPQILDEMRGIVLELRDRVQNIGVAPGQVETALSDDGSLRAAGGDDGGGGGEGSNGDGGEEENGALDFSMTDAILYAPAIAAQMMIFAGTLFFFLLSRQEIYDWISRRRDGTARGITSICLRNAETRVARYFLTIAIINAGLGVFVSFGMMAIGMPAPFAWGMAAGVINFILYLGPVVFAGCLLVAGTVVFDGAASFLPMAVYVGINSIEAQFVTPTFVGRQMAVNPLLVFLSLVFWLWLWGPMGGIVAIPLLVWGIAVSRAFAETPAEAEPEPAPA